MTPRRRGTEDGAVDAVSLLGNLRDLLGEPPDRGWSCPPPEVLPTPDLGTPPDLVGSDVVALVTGEPGSGGNRITSVLSPRSRP